MQRQAKSRGRSAAAPLVLMHKEKPRKELAPPKVSREILAFIVVIAVLVVGLVVVQLV